MVIKNQQNFWSGIMFVVLGFFFAYNATSYNMGTAARMGAGYFPFWLGVLLAVLGALLTLGSLKGEKDDENNVSKFDFDILFLIIGSLFSFALMMNYLGLFVALAFLVLVSSLASYEFSLKVAVGNAIFLLAFTYFAFIKGLGLVFPYIPVSPLEWPVFAMILIPMALVIGVVMLVRRVRG